LDNNGEYILLQKGEIYDPNLKDLPPEIVKFFSNHHQYKLQRTLSVRKEAVVCSTKRSDGTSVVIKLTNNYLELQILQQLGKCKEHIVEFLGTLSTSLLSFQYAFIMPQYDCTAKSWRGNELERCSLAYQLFQAIQQCHKYSIVHCDIKPSNILICYRPQLYVALADFGIADYCKNGNTLDQTVGTPQYMAPEILEQNEYSFPVDIWGAGVVLYELTTGQSLLKPQKQRELILDQIYAIHSNKRVFSIIQTSEKKLLMCLLQLQPEKRPTASQILCHPFFNGVKASSITNPKLEEIFV